MQTDVLIRPYTRADRDWLVEKHGVLYAKTQGFDESFGVLVGEILDEFWSEHDKSCEAGWIAQAGNQRLGSIFCVRLTQTTAKLRLFLLVPEARGLGVGRKMLSHCMGFARDIGYRDMTLWTHESHEAACALYRKTGWRLVDAKPVNSFGQDLVEQTWTYVF